MWLPRSVDPAGGIWATTRDVVRYARMHLGASPTGTKAIVSAESLQRMQEPALGVPSMALSIGRSWFVQDVGGVRTIMHNGDTAGQHTVFMAIPEKRFALVLFVNNIGAGMPAELETVDAALSQ